METTELCNQHLQTVIPGYRHCFHQVSIFCTRGLSGIMGTSQAQMVVVDFHNKSDNSGICATIQCCKYVMFIEFIIMEVMTIRLCGEGRPWVFNI